MQAILCHNPTAGLECHTKEDLLAALELVRLEAIYCSSKSKNLSDLLHQPADLIVVAGGDGTIEKVVANLPGLERPIGIVPIGSANNIARSYGIAGQPHELAEDWRLDRTQPLRVGVARGSWGEQSFLEGLGLGPIARVLQKKTIDKLSGSPSILGGRKALCDELKEAKPLAATVAVDDQPLEGDFVAVECISLPYFGPGLPVLTEIDQEDNKLNVVAVRASDCSDLCDWIEAPGTRPFPLEVVRGRRVELTWKLAPLHLDDEVVEGCDSLQSCSAQFERSARLLMPSPHRRGTGKQRHR